MVRLREGETESSNISPSHHLIVSPNCLRLAGERLERADKRMKLIEIRIARTTPARRIDSVGLIEQMDQGGLVERGPSRRNGREPPALETGGVDEGQPLLASRVHGEHDPPRVAGSDVGSGAGELDGHGAGS